MKLRWGLALLSIVVGGAGGVGGAACASLDGLAGGEGAPAVVDPCAASGAPSCEHGRCVAESGAAKCACDDGWSGATCRECAPGTSCGGPSCATTTCGIHAACDDASGSPKCNCVAGYAIQGSDCVWKGVILDPTFENKPEGAWTLTDGATFDPAAIGRDPGIVDLHGERCTVDKTRVTQAITMPPALAAEPLALDLTARASCSFLFGIDGPCFSPIAVNLGGRGIDPFSFLSRGGASRHMCLGERAFGGNHELSLATKICGGSTRTVALDHANILPHSECAALGQVSNAGFEDNGGWKASGTGAEVAAAVGDQGTRGGRLHHANRCDTPVLTGAISVRTSEPAKPALTFTAKGTSTRTMNVKLDSVTVGIITGTSTYERVRLCLPEYVKGMAGAITFSAAEDKGGVNCGDPDDYEFIVDDLKIESEASCPDTTLLVDGGFERDDTKRYWTTNLDGGSVTFPRSGNAMSGAAYASLSQSTCEKTSTFSGSAMVPEPKPGSGGPAFVFWYKATTATAISYATSGSGLAPTGTWTRSVECLPPRRATFLHFFAFSVSAAASCQTGNLALDDLQITHDPSCPEL